MKGPRVAAWSNRIASVKRPRVKSSVARPEVGKFSDRLFRHKDAGDSLALLLRRRLDLAHFVERSNHIVDQLSTFVDVRDLAASEYDRDDDLILVAKKPARLIELEVDVVLSGFWPEANLLNLALMRVGFAVLLLLLIFELAEIHDSANRGSLAGRNLDQVQIQLPSGRHGLIGGHDSQLSAVGSDNPNRRYTYLIVDSL